MITKDTMFGIPNPDNIKNLLKLYGAARQVHFDGGRFFDPPGSEKIIMSSEYGEVGNKNSALYEAVEAQKRLVVMSTYGAQGQVDGSTLIKGE